MEELIKISVKQEAAKTTDMVNEILALRQAAHDKEISRLKAKIKAGEEIIQTLITERGAELTNEEYHIVFGGE